MKLTIVMYHFVRPDDAPFPLLKSRRLQDFKGQLDFLQSRHTIVDMEQVLGAFRGLHTLPENAALLTFDDGYSDHYRYVFPELVARKISGSFYAPVSAVKDRKLLSVNKIHLLLATVQPSRLMGQIDDAVANALKDDVNGMFDVAVYRQEYHRPSRLDNADVIYVKRMLQHALPDDFRENLVDGLLSTFVSGDASALAEELYMSTSDLKDMRSAGMHVGGHGADHIWLNRCTVNARQCEIDKSVAFLRQLGVSEASLTFCYPYGAYDGGTIDVLIHAGFHLALTTKVAVAEISQGSAFELPRLDTVDLPVAA